MATLPAIFEDGKPLDERAYPWILNGLVRRHFEKLKVRRTFLDKFEEIISIILAWWVVPLTLLWFWLRYIPRHDWIGTYLHIGLITISMAAGLFFHSVYTSTLRGNGRLPFNLLNCWRDKRAYKRLGVVISLLLLIMLSYGSINGTRDVLYPQPWYKWRMSFVPRLFSLIRYDVFANLVEEDISTKPDNYWLMDSFTRDSAIIGAQLANADLRYADAHSSFLAYADLRNTNLKGIYMDAANLMGAKLDNAILDDAYLSSAILQNSRFINSSLQRTNFIGADLCGVYFFNSQLYRADFNGADLTGAVFRIASLNGASLIGAILKGADLRTASGLKQTELDETCGDSLTKLPSDTFTIPICDSLVQ